MAVDWHWSSVKVKQRKSGLLIPSVWLFLTPTHRSHDTMHMTKTGLERKYISFLTLKG